MTVAVVQQLRSDHRLQKRLGLRWQRIVALERLARGGGATNWFVALDGDDVREVFVRLSPGSSVTFYFAAQVPSNPMSPDIRRELETLVRATGEVMIGRRPVGSCTIEMDLISGPEELSEYLAEIADGTDVFWGTWPGRDDDGFDAVSVTLVDADGVLRPHPH